MFRRPGCLAGQASQVGDGERLCGEAGPRGDAIAPDPADVREFLQHSERGPEATVQVLLVVAGPLGVVDEDDVDPAAEDGE